MSENVAGSFQVPAGIANIHKNALRKRKFSKSWTTKVLGQELVHGGLTGLEPPQAQVFWSKMKIYVEITYSEQFSFYKKKLVCHFWDLH